MSQLATQPFGLLIEKQLSDQPLNLASLHWECRRIREATCQASGKKYPVRSVKNRRVLTTSNLLVVLIIATFDHMPAPLRVKRDNFDLPNGIDRDRRA